MNKLLTFFSSIYAVITAVIFFLGLILFFLVRFGIGTGSNKYILLAFGGILLIALLIAGIYFLWRFLEKRRGDKMEKELTNDALAKRQQRQQTKIAVQDIQQRWSDAMATLKSAKVRIYDLPWLLLIGEPQSGKTTTLRESGLDFPVGKDALSGSGGTVNCDWWFTNDAVILDTAGRFTMPVDSAPDRDEWQAFLKLLVRYRPRCPINGVIVTIPTTSLLYDSDEIIQDKARKIQEKLNELIKILGIEFPVYIMISKLDLVYGFAEFCSSLSSQERIQAMGWNRKDTVTRGFNSNEFEAFFFSLINRLHSWSLRRLREIPSGCEADRVYAFPGEFGRLKDTLGKYLNHIFKQDKFHAPLLLRGCYFSSGLQEGKAITKALLGEYGGILKGVLSEAAKSFVQSRAYFINVFYRKVFKEQGFVQRAGKASQKEIVLRIAAGAIALLIITSASWMLISGYNDLSNMVQPLEQHVRKAQNILLTPGYPDTESKVAEIISVLDKLEAGRQQLMTRGAKNFLKTKENIVVRKLGRIEDALFEQKILYKILLVAGENIQNLPALENPAQKDRFLQMILLYVNTKAGMAISGASVEAMMEFVPWESGNMSGIPRGEIERLIKNYPYGDMPNMAPGMFGGNVFHLRSGLDKVFEFWTGYYPHLWHNIQKSIVSINTSFSEIGTMNIAPGEIAAAGRFANKAKEFISAVAFLDSVEQKDKIWTNYQHDKCISDYDQMRKILSDQAIGDILALVPVAERHSKVCSELDGNVGNDWNATIKKNSHIINLDASLDSKMMAVKEAITKTLSFGPLFSQEKMQRLKGETEDPKLVLESWDQAWKQESEAKSKEIISLLSSAPKEGVVNEISDKLTATKPEAWANEKLPINIKAYLDHIVWEANRDATIDAIRVLADNSVTQETRFQPGMEPPKAVRASWLNSRFKVFTGLYSNLKNKYPAASNSMKPIQEEMATIMLNSWKNCLLFWNNTLKSYNPGEKILTTKTWEQFRREAMEQQGIFIDPGAWPLNSFFDNMAMKDIEELKSTIWSAVDKSASSANLRSLELQIEKTAYVYGARYLDKLDQAQNNFNSCLKSLNSDAATAWQQLNSAKSGGAGTFMDDFKSLSVFYLQVERDALSRGEPLAARLATIEEHGLGLLSQKAESGFEKDWQNFLSNFGKKFTDQFPFGEPEKWNKGDNIDANSRTLSFHIGEVSDLKNFFFSPETGFEPFVLRHGLVSSNKTTSRQLNQIQQKFITNSNDWKNFLFDDRGRPKSHNFEIILNENKENFLKEAASNFTQLVFNGLLDEKGKALRLRFSGNRYKQGSIKWALNSEPTITIEATNEETGKKASLRLTGGSLSFPAFIISQGRKEESTRLAGWEVDLQLPKSLFANRDSSSVTQSGFVIVPIRVVLDEPLPENIDWPQQ